MANGSGMAFNGQEWNVHVADVSSETKVVEPGVATRLYIQLQGQIWRCSMKIGRFFKKARDIAASEPTKAIHGVKVGMALSLVSLFYYMKPLYDGVGGNAMWAVMTVVVAFEYSVGSLGIGVHWIANQCGELEPVILQASVAILVCCALVKSVQLINALQNVPLECAACEANLAKWEPAHGRFKFRHPWKQYLRVGASMRSCAYCIETLNGFIRCVTEYFKDNEERSGRKQEGYKSVLNSKASEEAMAPELLKKHLKEVCMTLTSSCSVGFRSG
nr:hypothetical protein [Tanacetum cinerariifolium]